MKKIIAVVLVAFALTSCMGAKSIQANDAQGATVAEGANVDAQQ